MSFEKSGEFYDRAVVIPGRSNTRSKAPGKFFDVGAGPLYAARGRGSLLESVDGIPYVDMLCGLGAISLGYGVIDPPVFEGVFSLPHYVEVLASEEILSHVAKWATRVRSVRTGSESTTAAMLIARRATGRRPIFVAKNAYHAWHPWAAFRDQPGTDGEWTFSYDYGSLASVAKLVSEVGNPAAIVIEPARWEETPTGYLAALQAYAASLGSLFVVDEMIYGGRWRLGGACELYGLKPDLACFGKAFGNGRPVAFLAGGDVLDRYGEFVSGTYSGDAGSLATVVDVLAFYRDHDVVSALWERGNHVAASLRQAISDAGVGGLHLEGAAVHQRIRFEKPELGKVFSAELALRAFLWHPDVVNVSYSHTKRQIDRLGTAACESLVAMKARGEL